VAARDHGGGLQYLDEVIRQPNQMPPAIVIVEDGEADSWSDSRRSSWYTWNRRSGTRPSV
jgi:hypothetical protein